MKILNTVIPELSLRLLNIPNCQTVLKFLAVTLPQIVYISMNYLFANLLVAWL